MGGSLVTSLDQAARVIEMAKDVPRDDEDPTPLFEFQDDRVDPTSLDLVSEEEERERAEQERQEQERAELERQGEPPAAPGPTDEGPAEEVPTDEGPAWEPPPPSVVGIEQAPPTGVDLWVPEDDDGAMFDAGPVPNIPELVDEPAPAPAPPEPDPEEFETLPDIEPVLSEDPIEPAGPTDDTLT
jgi:hypothetical protein